MRCQSKKVFVDAIRFNYEDLDGLEEFLGHPVFNMCIETSHLDNTVKHWFKLPTLDGIVKVQEGDYIIKYIEGDIIVRKPTQFKRQFEKIK